MKLMVTAGKEASNQSRIKSREDVKKNKNKKKGKCIRKCRTGDKETALRVWGKRQKCFRKRNKKRKKGYGNKRDEKIPTKTHEKCEKNNESGEEQRKKLGNNWGMEEGKNHLKRQEIRKN